MKIYLFQYSHPTLHSPFFNLAVNLAESGHEVHLHRLGHKRIPLEDYQTPNGTVTCHALDNPYGAGSGALIFDVKTTWTPALRANFTTKRKRWAVSVKEKIKEIEPDLIITEGMIAMSLVGLLNESMELPAVIIPWVHYLDHDYKYGLTSGSDMVKIATSACAEFVKQPDAIWATRDAYAARIAKDYRLASVPKIVNPSNVKRPLKDFTQSSPETLNVILVNSHEPRQIDVFKKMLAQIDDSRRKRTLVYDVAPPWVAVEESTKIEDETTVLPNNPNPRPSAEASFDAKLRWNAKRILKVNSKQEAKEKFGLTKPKPSESTGTDYVPPKISKRPVEFKEFCLKNSIRHCGGSDFESGYLLKKMSYKRGVVVSLLSRQNHRQNVRHFIGYFHISQIVILNGNLENFESIPDNLKVKTTTNELISTSGYLDLVEKFDQKIEEMEFDSVSEIPTVSEDLLKNLNDLMEQTKPVSVGGELKVWHGLTGCAGQPWIQSTAQSRAGISAQSMIVGPNYLNYQVHKHFTKQNPVSEARALAEVSRNFNVAHFYFRSLFYNSIQMRAPAGLDMLALRAAGRTVIMNFRGSEVRLQETFRDLNPYHYVDERPPAVAKFPDEIQRGYLDFVRSIASEMVVIDPELGSFVPDAKVIPRSLDLSHWEHIGQVNKTRPVVVHAPTKADIKGTSYVLAAVDRLQKEGLDFEFRLIKGLSNSEAHEAYKSADIIVDQLRIGWYGVLSVEAMALGKAVICYIRNDLIDNFPNEKERPFCIANPDNILGNLRELITDRKLREGYAERGYAYCRETHDSDKVAKQYIELYEQVQKNPRPVNIKGVFEHLERQEHLISDETKSLVERILSK